MTAALASHPALETVEAFLAQAERSGVDYVSMRTPMLKGLLLVRYALMAEIAGLRTSKAPLGARRVHSATCSWGKPGDYCFCAAEPSAERVWEDLCGELRMREARMSGILCDLADVPSDPVEGLRVLAEHYRRLRPGSAQAEYWRCTMCNGDHPKGMSHAQATRAAERVLMTVRDSGEARPVLDVERWRRWLFIRLDSVTTMEHISEIAEELAFEVQPERASEAARLSKDAAPNFTSDAGNERQPCSAEAPTPPDVRRDLVQKLSATQRMMDDHARELATWKARALKAEAEVDRLDSEAAPAGLSGSLAR